jgi:cell division septation protein DedD
MKVCLFSLLFLCLGAGSETPNFYPTYTSAREASRSSPKEMLIFFTKKSCKSCGSAWKAFEQDGKASAQFISTIIDADDFDGGIFFDKYSLNSVPAWVILDATGTLKEKWEGGWKGQDGKPIPLVQDETKIEDTKENPKIATTDKPSTPPQNTPTEKQIEKSTPSASNSTIASNEKTQVASVVKTSHNVNNPASDYVLQAGYFGSESNAKKLESDLHTKGYGSFHVKVVTQNGSNFYRVVSGSFSTEHDANKELETLARAGIKATVKKSSEI